jgi:hypothetical protein
LLALAIPKVHNAHICLDLHIAAALVKVGFKHYWSNGAAVRSPIVVYVVLTPRREEHNALDDIDEHRLFLFISSHDTFSFS